MEIERKFLITHSANLGRFGSAAAALGLTREDARRGRLHIEGRSSSGEYAPGFPRLAQVEYQTAKVQAMSLLSAQRPTPSPARGGGRLAGHTPT